MDIGIGDQSSGRQRNSLNVHSEGGLLEMSKLSLISEIWCFMRQNKKWWLMPILLILLGMGVLIAFTGGSALAPFIYTIF